MKTIYLLLCLAYIPLALAQSTPPPIGIGAVNSALKVIVDKGLHFIDVEELVF
jgi:hypothetical protein